jgi:hypothetical protein
MWGVVVTEEEEEEGESSMAAPVVGDACDEAVGHKQRLLAFSCVVSGVRRCKYTKWRYKYSKFVIICMDNHLYKDCWSNIFEANCLYF